MENNGENITAQIIETIVQHKELAACLMAGVPLGVGTNEEGNIVLRTQVHVAFRYNTDGDIEEVLMKKEEAHG